jgi:hypothetical protein
MKGAMLSFSIMIILLRGSVVPVPADTQSHDTGSHNQKSVSSILFI